MPNFFAELTLALLSSYAHNLQGGSLRSACTLLIHDIINSSVDVAARWTAAFISANEGEDWQLLISFPVSVIIIF